ncbi:ATP-binding protein [Paraflavisolibacter sp. H34]|uniref:ATP-binding protein n=1 Tax=Huijunlia imazamoxiresistens TaxID=3127457 RepID=UPI00301A6C23
MEEKFNDPSLFQEFFNTQPQGLLWARPVFAHQSPLPVDFEYAYSNEVGSTTLGLTPAELVGRRLSTLTALPEETRAVILRQMAAVYQSGEKATSVLFNPLVGRYFKSLRGRIRDGVLTILQDVTEENRIIEELHHQRALTDSILEVSPNGIFVARALPDPVGNVQDFLITRINPAFSKLLGLSEDQVLQKSFLSVFPASRHSGAFKMYRRVFQTGSAERQEFHYRTEYQDSWYQVATVKLEEGILVTFTDITDQKHAAQHIEQQRSLLESILMHSSSGISVGEVFHTGESQLADLKVLLTNEAASRMTGIPRELVLSRTAAQLAPHYWSSTLLKLSLETWESGIARHTEVYWEATGKWLEVTLSKMSSGLLLFVLTDISALKEAKIAVEQSAERLQTIINRAQTGIFTATPLKDEQGAIIDFRFVLVNQAVADYLGQQADRLMDEPGSNWFPGYRTNGLFEQFRDTYQTGKVNRFDFHYNMEGIDAWIDLMCTRLGAELLVTFSDFTPVKQLQLQLEQSVEELKRSNSSLEEFAYAASHDLQEPLRKILYFSERLKAVLAPNAGEEDIRLFHRLDNAAVRMRRLIEDLLAYSKVSVAPNRLGKVQLREIVGEVLQDLEAALQQSDARVQVEELPEIQGDPTQLRQLFQNLIGNALKYRKENVPPEISVRCRAVEKGNPLLNELPGNGSSSGHYYLVEVADNGIGFEQQDAEKIFQIFQRLHGRSQYEGTGVGLAIVQKVVANHKGLIRAQGEPGKGATFQVLLPA